MSDQGRWGTGSGCRRPEGGYRKLLFRAQTGQAVTYSLTSPSMDGHQKHCPTTRESAVSQGDKKPRRHNTVQGATAEGLKSRPQLQSLGLPTPCYGERAICLLLRC
ncbi:unnamed protein product [Pleuronectes platessa]|uniref:Uncharacterized protein n=1 Tax=Pleuronectes platessa TaxID=8262 RepID=A0A9N7VDD2_PLEPL|nr:unnamed protein product [Pleuronectes platessa]